MPLKTQLDDQPTLNLTPMLDIVFNLIIFFMVGTRFTSIEQSIDVQVPQVSAAGTQSAVPAKIVVNVRRDGAVVVDQDTLTFEALGERLRVARQANRKVSVIVRGDGEGALKHAAEVLAVCRKAGISDLGIAVRVASGKGQGASR